MSNLLVKDLNICVIEPSPTQAKIIESHLRSLQVQHVTIFNDGLNAIDTMEQHYPDLVISAMYLPDMTGTDVVLAMRDNDRLESVPFMLISSETSFTMLEPIRQAGVIAILPKPFNPEDLKKALYSTLDYINPDNTTLSAIELEHLSVLVVDDSPLSRKHIIRVLHNIGIEKTTQAKDGTEAVKLLGLHFYDLVVTDYNMPKMDGEHLTRHIRELSNQPSMPIIMVTSEGDGQRLSAVLQAGVSGICDKPFAVEQVKALIKRCFT